MHQEVQTLPVPICRAQSNWKGSASHNFEGAFKGIPTYRISAGCSQPMVLRGALAVSSRFMSLMAPLPLALGESFAVRYMAPS